TLFFGIIKPLRLTGEFHRRHSFGKIPILTTGYLFGCLSFFGTFKLFFSGLTGTVRQLMRTLVPNQTALV
ncbi:hypothetical protein, partial [Neisseria gonorrhoeae]|uniref:hypothetical protein n=1 Tax=Neisseria gonorrhoeae TaxID=485 RepID=UPI0021C11AE1